MLINKGVKISHIFVTVGLSLLFIPRLWCQSNLSDTLFQNLLNKAIIYDGHVSNRIRDVAVEKYLVALSARPDNQENLEIEVRIAYLCSVEMLEEETPRFNDAIIQYESILAKYPPNDIRVLQARIYLATCYAYTDQFSKTGTFNEGAISKAENQYDYIMRVDDNKIQFPDNFSSDGTARKERIASLKRTATDNLIGIQIVSDPLISILNLENLTVRYPNNQQLISMVKEKIAQIQTTDLKEEATYIIRDIERGLIK